MTIIFQTTQTKDLIYVKILAIVNFNTQAQRKSNYGKDNQR
jgi:hypothetical protein